MKMIVKRGMALLMALVLIVGFVPATVFTAAASTVEYKYDGNYIYNWGTREEVATFLSPNAATFYEDISYYDLAALSGSATEASVPSSELYAELQSIMADAHETVTTYDGTRDLFQYTDCENNGSPETISGFYSGQAVGPAWDSGSTWNREHTWPNSKGDMAGNGENDIMMLRPAATSVNSSRGNKAYGESTDYYDPNSVSEGAYDLRGDVARIVLYVYVRWGCTNTGADYNPDGIFGTEGVIESKDLLLDWMVEDPVDTWEMGRNDSVESITGTRNIFIDYPELAFELFEEDVPADMQTPSGIAAASAYSITAQSGNDARGTVSVSGNVITATPNEGYEVSGYELVNGAATVSQNGNTFTVYPTTDCTVQINFAARTQYTVSFSGATGVANQTVYAGESIELPDVTNAPDGYTFLGWMETELTEDTTDEPAYYTGAYTPATSVTLHALYSYMGAGAGTGGGDYVKVTEAPSDWSGEYVIVYEDGSLIFNGSLDTFDATNNYISVTISNNTIAAAEADPYKFIIAAMDGGYSIQGASGKYIGHGSNANGLTTSDSALKNTISLDNSGNANIVCAGGAYLRYNAASNQRRFRYYKSSSYTGQKAIALYRKEAAAGVLTYTGDPLHCDHANTTAIGEAVEATCTATGMTAGEMCIACGKIITAQQVIPKKEHSYESVVTLPTCTAAGYTTYTCSVCGDSCTADEVPVKEHDFVDGVCTVCGTSDSIVDLSGDYYIAAKRSTGNYFYMTNDLGSANTKRYQAKDSGVTELPAAITSPTNSNVFTLELQTDGTYKICAKYAEGDNYLGWTSDNSGLLVAEESALSLTVNAANTEGAYNIYCGDRYLSLNNQTGSNYFAFYAGTQVNDLYLIPVNDEGGCQHANTTVTGKVDATCTEDGYTGDTVCSDCNAIVEYGEIKKATGHSYVDGTCENCGEAENSVVIPEIPETGVYKLVTDIAEVKNGGKFVIVANVNGTYYAMGNTLSSSKLNCVEVNILNDMVYTADAPTWTVGAYSGSIVLTDGTKYLKHSSSTNLSTVTEVYPWTVTAADSGFNLISSTDDSRVLTFRANGNNIFGAYALSNNNNGEYFADLQMYKLVEGELPTAESTLSFCENGQTTTTATLAVDSTYIMPETANAAPEGYTFVGWVEEQELDETSIKPESVLEAGSEYTVGNDTTFYALYSIIRITEGDKVFQLVTDAGDLAAGDKIVIAASGYDYAISTTQNNNNRAQASIVKNGTTITFADDVQVLTLETGNVAGTFALNTGSGYLYAASSSDNYLKTKSTLDDNGSWLIAIENGSTSVVAQGTSTRNVMQYNQSSKLFACYGSASQKAIVLYQETVDTTETAYYTTCVHNVVTDEAVAATDSEDGLTAGEHCSICGKILVAQEVIPCLVGKVENWNITLKEDLGVNFYLSVNDSIKDDAQLKVTFYGTTTSRTAAECYDEALGAYVVRVDAAAAQMMDDIVVQITDGGEKIVTKTYTIRQYAEYILNSDLEEHVKYHPMVKEMLNYGAKAQTYFEYNKENPANKDINGVGTQNVPESAPLEKSVSGSTEGITFYGATLLFRNKIALRYYFEPEDVNVEYTFTVNGVAYTPQKKQGLLYIEIPGITPECLDEQYQVVVGTGDDPLTVTYGPMNYLVNMNVKGSDNLKALVNALYNYHLAAEALTQE